MKFLIINILVLVFVILNQSYSYAQNKPCLQLEKNYISDGQEYLIITKQTEVSKLNVLFYPGIDYKIKYCPENSEAIIQMSILDQNNKLFFTNSDKNYTNEWNFKFQAIMNASINLKIKQSINNEEPVRVLISYRTKK